MVAGHPASQAKIFVEVATHPFAKEFFPSVAIFGKSGVGVLLFERNEIRIFLLLRVIDTCRRRIEETLDIAIAGGEQHVGIGQHAEHAEGLVVMDESHASHVGCELKDDVGIFDGLATCLDFA